MVLKMIPIALVVACAYSLFDRAHFTFQDGTLSSFVSSLPVALYTLIGFETCCSIGHIIEGGAQRLSSIVVTSFLIVALIATLFQFSLFGALGIELASLKAPMSAYFHALYSSKAWVHLIVGTLVNVCITISVLGACYGILYANNWNIYVILKDILPSSYASRWAAKNSHGIHIPSLLIQCSLIAFFSCVGFPLVVLTRMTVLGVVICYTLVTCSLIKSYKHHAHITMPRWVAYASFMSCFYIAGTCLKDLL
jgi:amino acid transporter